MRTRKRSIVIQGSEDEVREAVRRGLLTAPARPASGPPPALPVMPLEKILAGLAADRGER